MMPVATPPNAVVFGSNRITMAQMRNAGLWLNLTAIVLITIGGYLVFVPVLG
jgi:sodium-dependent dicarboxylate transporter 2/3/5